MGLLLSKNFKFIVYFIVYEVKDYCYLRKQIVYKCSNVSELHYIQIEKIWSFILYTTQIHIVLVVFCI